MQVNIEDIRRSYEMLSDEALLAMDRTDLATIAQPVYDAELALRGLSKDDPVDAAAGVETDPDELTELAEFTSADEMSTAKSTLRAAGISVFDNINDLSKMKWMFEQGAMDGLKLFVPRAQMEDAQVVLDSWEEIDEEELARQSEQFKAPE